MSSAEKEKGAIRAMIPREWKASSGAPHAFIPWPPYCMEALCFACVKHVPDTRLLHPVVSGDSEVTFLIMHSRSGESLS